MTGKLSRAAPLGSRALLDHILDQPGLVAAIESLPAQVLGRLIDHVGLEDASDLVALATTEQLRSIFDEDLWHSPRPGQAEVFDGDRFARWLEVMLEAGEDFAAQRMVEMSEDLFTLALNKQVLVVDLDALAVVMADRMSDDDALVEKALESSLGEEIGQYRIIARRSEGWDALWSVLLVLDRDHHAFLERVLERCCYATSEYVEENGGLYDVLSSEEMLEVDAAAEREDRRAEAGYVSPANAAAFLALARKLPIPDVLGSSARDPLTHAYFRDLREGPRGAPPKGSPVNAAATKASPTPVADLVALLRAADVVPEAAARLLTAAPGLPDEQDALGRALRALAASDSQSHARHMAELAYLANALQAGSSFEGRRLRPGEAVRAAAATANLGLVYCIDELAMTVETSLAIGVDKLFRVAWRLLFERASLAAAEVLAHRLESMAGGAARPARARAAAALRAAMAAGKPWTVRPLLQQLGEVVDPVLLAALDECPHLGGNLLASPGRDGDEPRAVVFVGTPAQLRSLEAGIAACSGSSPES